MAPCVACGRIAELDEDGLCAVCSPDPDAEEARHYVVGRHRRVYSRR